MNGRAWVVEEQVLRGGLWYPLAIYETRALARVNAAHEYRPRGYVVRVRQYIRQQETRP